ncbi:unnamed protein product, partial [Tetraodon nigroviridis]
QVNGDIPPRLKKSAHEVILEFIRSRPPLNPASPVSARKLKPQTQPPPMLHKRILEEIKAERKLGARVAGRGAQGKAGYEHTHTHTHTHTKIHTYTHTHTHSQPSDSSMLLPRSYTRTNNPHVHTSHTHTPCKSCI